MAETWLDSITAEEYQKHQGLLLDNFELTSAPLDRIEELSADEIGFLVPLCMAKQVGDVDTIEPRVVDISKSQVTKRFVDLPDALRRVLVPTAKIYKTFVNEEGEQIDLRLKTDYWNNGLNRVELERIDFTRKGGNPAEVDTNIQFNIKLSARELGFFFKKQYPIAENDGVGTGVGFQRECEAKGVAWIDLIKIDPGRSLQVDSESVINESDARIKVILGYADIGGADSDFKPPEMSDNEWTRWRNTIVAQEELFYLNIHQHQFDFKASGEVSLSVDFIAQGNGVMLTPNSDILLGPRLKERYRIKRAQRKREQKRLREAQQATRRDGGEVYQACADDEVEKVEGIIEGTTNQLEYLVELGRRRILNQLELGIMFPAEDLVNSGAVTRLKNAFNMAGSDGMTFSKWHNVQVDDDGNAVPRHQVKNSDGTIKVEMPYIFLGDIIDAAMELLAANEWLGEEPDDGTPGNESAYRRKIMNNPTSTFFMPWSEYESNDPRRVKTIEKYGGVIFGDILFKKPDGLSYKGSLLKLPICYPLFVSWWKAKTANMTVFYFKDFVSSLLTDFIPNHVFSSAAYDEDPVATERDSPEFSVFSVNTPKKAVKELVLDSTWHSHTIESDAYEEKVAPFATNVIGLSTDIQSSFMVIGQVKRDGATNSTKTPKIIWGQSTKGILERVQFKREDIPGYAVARLMADRQSTANNMMLREKYNTTIDMIGTTAFLPGGSVFLDPAPLDLGYSSTRGSLARQLGLGGLYTVLYVDHQMDFVRKSWTTSLDTKWESYGDGSTGDNPPSGPCEDLFGAERLTLGEQVDLWASVSREARENAAAAQARLDGNNGSLSSTEIANLNDLIATELERATASDSSKLEYEAQIQEEFDRDARIEELGISEEEMSQLEYVAADGSVARAVTQSPLGMIVGGVFGAFDSVAESFNDEETE